jgi:hypothetical protein
MSPLTIEPRVRSLCNGYPLRYYEGGGRLTGLGPFQAPPQGGLENLFSGQAGGGGLTRETDTRGPEFGRWGGGGGLEASESLSGPPGDRKNGLE